VLLTFRQRLGILALRKCFLFKGKTHFSSCVFLKERRSACQVEHLVYVVGIMLPRLENFSETNKVLI
jgi:hypothetical protein